MDEPRITIGGAPQDDERVPDTWPYTAADLPPELDVRVHGDTKATPKELQARLEAARRLFRDLGEHWLHYGGTVYRVRLDALTINAETGEVMVSYYEDGQLAGHRPQFSLPISDWLSVRSIGDGPAAHNPNSVDVLTQPGYVYRYVPVFKADRFETMRQIEERGQ